MAIEQEVQTVADVEVDLGNAKGGCEKQITTNSSYQPLEGRNEIDSNVDLELVKEVRELLRNEYKNEGEKFALKHYAEILDEESPSTCWRYLFHCQKKLKETVDLMKATLIWRKEIGCEEPLQEDEIVELYHYSAFNITGKSKDGRHIIYVIGKNFRKPSDVIKPLIRRLVARILFTWDSEHKNDLDQIVVVFDISNTGYKNIDLDMSAWLVSIKDFAPARINQIFILGIPFIVRPLIRIIISWLPENFRKIIHCGSFEQLVAPVIDEDNLPYEIVGEKKDLHYKLAPKQALWMKDSPAFIKNPAMEKALEDVLGYSINKELRERLRALQLEMK